MSTNVQPESDAAKPPEDDQAIATGRILRQRFELLEEIGRGGLSRVFKARDMVAERAGLAKPVVALKIIETGADGDPDIVALLYREARRLRDLVHPNIVRVYDMDVEDETHFMVMEHLEGQTLSRALRKADGHKLPLSQVDRIVADVCLALQFAHASNVVHADLKPANVFITTSGLVKLIDFNMAYPMGRARKTDEEDTVEILGRLGGVTPAYASPQRLSGAEPSEGDDIFSLAVLIHIALTGIRPFGSLTALDAKEKGEAADIAGWLAARRRSALRRALALDDRERTPSIGEFATEYSSGNFRAWMAHFFGATPSLKG